MSSNNPHIPGSPKFTKWEIENLRAQNKALVAALTACLCCEFPVTDREVIKQAGEALALAKGAA